MEYMYLKNNFWNFLQPWVEQIWICIKYIIVSENSVTTAVMIMVISSSAGTKIGLLTKSKIRKNICRADVHLLLSFCI